MESKADRRTGPKLFTFARVSSAAIALAALVTGYIGL